MRLRGSHFASLTSQVNNNRDDTGAFLKHVLDILDSELTKIS